MNFVREERARCRALVAKLARGTDKEFLLYALDNAVSVEEIPEQRRRFEELQPEDPLEDLM
jgi:hypothetical protein